MLRRCTPTRAWCWPAPCLPSPLRRLGPPAPRAVRLVAAFHVRRTESVTVSIDGRGVAVRSLALDSTSGELQARLIDASAAAPLPERWQRRRLGVEATFGPGQTRRVQISGTTVPTPTSELVDSWTMEPIATRHRMLGHDPAADAEYPDDSYYLVYLMYPKDAWAGVGKTEIVVRYPDGCELGGGIGSGRWRSVARAEGVATARAATTGKGVKQLALRLTFPFVRMYHGGPVVGLGGDVIEDAGFRLRVGYEFSGPPWLVYSLSADSDLKRRLVVAPAVEAATRASMFALIPSFSGGLGVPIRVVPEATVGIRGQLGLQFPAFGFAAALDVYPALWADEDPDRIDLTLMGRVSL